SRVGSSRRSAPFSGVSRRFQSPIPSSSRLSIAAGKQRKTTRNLSEPARTPFAQKLLHGMLDIVCTAGRNARQGDRYEIAMVIFFWSRLHALPCRLPVEHGKAAD